MFADRRPLHLVLGLTLLFAATFPAVASPFWVAYEGDDFPENQGWRRVYGDENGPYKGGAVRSLEDGCLVSDGLRNDQIFDFYRRDLLADPGPGETFVAEWRVLVDTRSDPHDVGVAIMRASTPGDALIGINADSLEVWPGPVTIGLAPNRFHSFHFQSSDMVAFALIVDNTITINGTFDSVTPNQRTVSFGDGTQGERSCAVWDFFRFGIVPEPRSGVCVCALGGLGFRRLVGARGRMRRRTGETRP